jgi:hypothetical protein
MKDLLQMVLAIAATLAFVGVTVAVGHDTTTLVSPPEAVAEQFARKLAGGRYDVASQHLEHDSPELRAQVRSVSDALRARAGAIGAIDGKAGAIEGDQATASALITSARAGEIVMRFVLVRRAGSWRIAEF